MAELEVDQSNLPKVQEVCQCFAVLEDGALAHNLQEQEIEQYYTSNVQRNQLVQKDIRVAKSLQDEEKHTALVLQQQTTHQLEERDTEYAQMIQEEIQRCAEEARRREVEDEEIAKRIQEEEELCVRSRGSYQNRDARETSSVPPFSPRAVYSPEDRYYERSSTRRRERSQLPPYSHSEDNQRMPTVANISRGSQDCSSSTVGQRSAVGCGRPSRSHSDQDNTSTTSGSSVSQKSRTSHLSGGWGDVIKLIRNDMSEQGYLSPSSEEELFEPVYKLERMLKQKQQASDRRGDRGTTGRNGTTALDLGELEQVLLDEELARRLQEEERLAAETPQGSSPLSPEDFRMAQVAQDEEIARFIQKQEIKAKRRSAELDFVGPRQEYRDTVTEYDRRAECDRQRERMGSDGLQSPIDDSTADHQLSSPVSMAAQPMRNVAEDLDPTFHRKEINGANQGSQQGGLCNAIEEQPAFVPPTKRHNDKPGRVKSKDKKENIKQKENCKQQ
ncbi:hypothetical protein E1301_Tti002536 [Triplophysa tibetana]|uniref:Coiled-coil domain-containing protein n=1 Tax=Triplophysa tibetana TaxID=1572043 RepID=A0A5A9NDE3_9TELE|nr:hypothetical protein E1301_Tti002536 [Triplophysa tibetana]